MSTHKHFDKICCVVLAVSLLLTVWFMNAESFGVQKASAVMGYEKKLFDTSTVHTIDIIMDDWEEFTANCKSEEYYACSVVIDNDAYKNVAIRGKGNTSLTQVESYGNDRYSFKIEFDHYDSTNTYYGLDKLCLNNIIQDNTYMKDYLSYQMMADMGVASPLCSYVYITVNGEDWGLYLAVEGIEESFLQRNYGNNYGEIYKPDSQSMGGGRGNGEKFDMDDFLGDDNESEASGSTAITGNTRQTEPELSGSEMPADPNTGGQMPDSNMPDDQMPNGQMKGNQMANDNMQGGQMADDNMQGGQMAGEMEDRQTAPELPEGEMPTNPDSGNTQGQMPGRGMGGGANGSDDVLLKYIDDNIDSYENIFNNAKTDISDSDKERLIAALKKLNSGEDLTDTVDIERVIRYFVVHNFVLNFDSYTGSMIHNYYLYEKDGQMQMIPWDYNLAFGGFESAGQAADLINYPIDSPVSGGNVEDRPMISWIFADEEYTELYHQYFAEFISEYFDSGYFEEMIDNLSSMLAPFVEKDPTKFCTYEEFENGVSTLKEFCLLRAESITGQLNGTIGSTSDTQESNTMIDAGGLQITDMGSMNNTMGGGGMERRADNAGGDMKFKQGNADDEEAPEMENSEGADAYDSVPAFADHENTMDPNTGNTNERMQKPGENGMPGEMGQMGGPGQGGSGQGGPGQITVSSAASWIWIGTSGGVLILGLLFVILFKRRKAF